MKKYPLLLIFAISSILIAGTIDLNNLDHYANSNVPNYITKDNTPNNNPITDAGATLGRVLFYDKKLSANETVSCASCHKQEFAFSDTAALSVGLNSELTGRHAMRLVNARFANEVAFFWDERAATLEIQSTMPIQDHVEMGFSGTQGDLPIDSLFTRLEAENYYQELFTFAYGDANVTEARIRRALAQFIRSIQSFDSKFDAGLAQVNNIAQPFPNFTAQENQGKALFIAPPGGPANGAGCQGCHQAPEFDIDPNSQNNGIIGNAQDPNATDLTVTKAPSLRDLVNPQGQLNGAMMHDASMTSIMDVINHYNDITFDPQINPQLDPRLRGGAPGNPGNGQQLNLTQAEKNALEAFLLTLTGSDIYTNPIWSNPFDANGNITIIPFGVSTTTIEKPIFNIYPNPTTDFINIELEYGDYQLSIFDLNGRLLRQENIDGNHQVEVYNLPKGIFFVRIMNNETLAIVTKKVIKTQ